jgi:hypothetical protein
MSGEESWGTEAQGNSPRVLTESVVYLFCSTTQARSIALPKHYQLVCPKAKHVMLIEVFIRPNH